MASQLFKPSGLSHQALSQVSSPVHDCAQSVEKSYIRRWRDEKAQVAV